jgi:hypothetical protein
MKPRITEAEWRKAKTLIDLDLYRSAWQQFRKWRLFGAACCHRAMAVRPDPRFEQLADASERFADGLMNWNKVKLIRKTLVTLRKDFREEFGPEEARHDIVEALDAATCEKPVGALQASRYAGYAFAAAARPKWDSARNKEEREQMKLARDIFGNPFRPVAFDPEWRTSNVVSLAKSMYESRDFTAMPILSDALQDSGCEHEDILNHCRDGNGVHVRCCWVVDLILKKS